VRAIWTAAAVIAVAGCAGTPFTWENVAQVKPGMTEAEVVAILGPPYSRTQAGSVSILTWSFASGFGGARAASFRLRDGRVEASTTLSR
jgi:hypothetical protein